MPFFDFHIHPSLKSQFARPADKPTPWDHIHLVFAHPDIILRLLKCQGIDDVVDSQASLTQMAEAGLNLIAIALHPPEAAMMNDGLIQKIADEEQTRFIFNDRIDAIGTGDIYFQLLNEELDHLEQHLNQGGKRLKLINHINEYNAADTNTIHAIINVEGPHAFYGKRSGRTLAQIMTDFEANFRQFTENRGVRIFAMNIAHLEQNDFCNHAFGIQIFKQDPFFPKGNGLTNEGLQLLQWMQEKQILCDIKHTSLFARRTVYGLGWHGAHWPLVCTHAGLTGIHSDNRCRYLMGRPKSTAEGFLPVKYLKPNGYLDGTSFNPCSINLYDDDVVTIIQSGGMIGLSMDQRILGSPDESMMGEGYTEEIFDFEVISPLEKDWFRDTERKFIGDEFVLKAEHIDTANDRRKTDRFHARHFLNQVFHLFVIARQNDIDLSLMASKICIGSDFDGMINPVDSCPNVTALSDFKELLLSQFIFWETEFENKAHFRVSDSIAPAQLLDQIFYQNALAFLQEWYT